MPARSKQLWSVLVIAGSASLLATGCKDQVARDQIAAINKYLGTTNGTGSPDPTLLKNIENNNLFLQKALTDMQCDILKLQHPGAMCPGPSTSPTVPPRYPQ